MTRGQAKDLVLVLLVAAVLGLTGAMLVGFGELSSVTSQNHALGVQNQALGMQNRALLHRVVSDEHGTCMIQARGLPAGHALVAAMADLHLLLTVSVSHASRREMRREPRRLRGLLESLNQNLAAYTFFESKQPHRRKC